MKTIDILKKYIKENLRPDDPFNLDENQSLLESGIIDSLGIMKLVTFIEDEFQLKISDEELIPENFIASFLMN